MSLRPLAPGFSLRSYRLERRLGVGAAGEVWLARDSRGQPVALKASARTDEQQEVAFRREFEQLRTLRLPNVVRVFDCGIDQGYVFFTMDVAEGEPFDRYVQRGSSLASQVRRLAGAGAQVARALANIHRLELAHRDIKPANVHVSADGRATVLDFGTARFGSASDSSSEFMGTVAYMAPEQRVGLPHDHRADLYALGVVLHESLSGVPAARWTPGRPRSPLLLLGAAVPTGLSWLVDRLLSLDPAARPSADEAEALLHAIATRAPLAPAPWPEPPAYAGDATRLLHGSAVVVGPPGTGRRRMVQEARWHWYRKGYRSIAAHCRSDQPFGAIRQLLRELFSLADPAARRALAGAEVEALKALWPDLPLELTGPLPGPPEPERAAAALAAVLHRTRPIAVVLWQADQADIGTAGLLPALARALPEGALIWATARRPVAGLRPIQPPPWGPEAEALILQGLALPEGGPLPSGGRSPLESTALAWAAVASARREPGPHVAMRPEVDGWDLPLLSLLDEPFPLSLAAALAPRLDQLLKQGHLCTTTPEGAPRAAGVGQEDSESTEPTDLLQAERGGGEWLRFADRGTRKLAAALVDQLPDAALRVAQATLATPPSPERTLRAAQEALEAGVVTARQLAAAVQVALDRGNPAELERWLQLQELHVGATDDWLSRYARIVVDFDRLPPALRRAELRALAAAAATEEQHGLATFLAVRDEARSGDPRLAITLAAEPAQRHAAMLPRVASMLLREVALARLELGQLDASVNDAHRARQLARIAAGREAPLTQTEVEASTPLSAALITSGRLQEAADFCAAEAKRCAAAGLSRGEGALRANLAITRLYQGERAAAADAAARCRVVQPRHGDPLVQAINLVTSARLAVELGDLVEGHTRLDEALSLSRGLQLHHQQGECYAIALDSALQRNDLVDGMRAIEGYGEASEAQRSDRDAWPAALARWRWMRGDLRGALEATELPRKGHGAAAVHVERARLWLIAGRYERAQDEAEAAAALCAQAGFLELRRMAQLVGAAAGAVDDRQWAQLAEGTGQSRWVHLYLGALHLDAIRRRMRHENVDGLINRLRQRAEDVGHLLYTALARADGW